MLDRGVPDFENPCQLSEDVPRGQSSAMEGAIEIMPVSPAAAAGKGVGAFVDPPFTEDAGEERRKHAAGIGCAGWGEGDDIFLDAQFGA